MQIVIEVDENIYTRLFDNGEDYTIVNDDLFALAKAIRKGTPLPEHHGRLIDADFIKELGAECIAARWDDNELYALGAIDEIPTIIPATEEGEWE